MLLSRWHRLGISFKGNSVTVMSDCSRQQTRPIDRQAGDAVDTSGIILLAQQIDDNTFFEASPTANDTFPDFRNFRKYVNIFQGDLQQLTLVSGPAAAYELCNSFVPGCDQPLPRQLQQQDDSQAGYDETTLNPISPVLNRSQSTQVPRHL